MSDIKLPEPFDTICVLNEHGDLDDVPVYTAKQAEAYAEARAERAAELERERCIAAIVAAGPQEGPLKLITDGFVQAIRGTK